MGDPELVARAQQAAARLERSWDRWRRLHGLAKEQAQPVSSYVGYSLAEPWGRPRVVFGVAAEEAEQLVALLEQEIAADPRSSQGQIREPDAADHPAQAWEHTASGAQQPAPAIPQQPAQAEHGAQSAPAGPSAQWVPGTTGFQPAPTAAAAGAPQRGVPQSIGADLAGWTSGELPGQATAGLAAWPTAGTAVPDGTQAIPVYQGPAAPEGAHRTSGYQGAVVPVPSALEGAHRACAYPGPAAPAGAQRAPAYQGPAVPVPSAPDGARHASAYQGPVAAEGAQRAPAYRGPAVPGTAPSGARRAAYQGPAVAGRREGMARATGTAPGGPDPSAWLRLA